MTNATGSFGGAPYLTAQGVSLLAPGELVTLPVRFSNPAMGAITFSPAVYTGEIK